MRIDTPIQVVLALPILPARRIKILAVRNPIG